MKKLYISIMMLLLVLPIATNAQVIENIEEDTTRNILSIKEKYYKTITYNNIFATHSTFNNDLNTKTIEITKEEYDNFSPSNINPLSTIETTYKKLTTTISQIGPYYSYRADLTWKNFPSTRSYDIIGIGFSSGVKIRSGLRYSTYYCISGSGCKTITANYPQTFTNGAGTSFKLPEGNLTELKTSLYFDVEKSNNNTLTYQLASGDYSHATSKVTIDQSKKYFVDSRGINLQGVSSSYDAIDSAKTEWYGNW